jgi:hypothetical protein
MPRAQCRRNRDRVLVWNVLLIDSREKSRSTGKGTCAPCGRDLAWVLGTISATGWSRQPKAYLLGSLENLKSFRRGLHGWTDAFRRGGPKSVYKCRTLLRTLPEGRVHTQLHGSASISRRTASGWIPIGDLVHPAEELREMRAPTGHERGQRARPCEFARSTIDRVHHQVRA